MNVEAPSVVNRRAVVAEMEKRKRRRLPVAGDDMQGPVEERVVEEEYNMLLESRARQRERVKNRVAISRSFLRSIDGGDRGF